MSEKTVREIVQRLSLRPPQAKSLETLNELVHDMDILNADDLDTKLQRVRSAYTSVTDFERDFPSLCFALATGVGKTRLMGAFITYLFREKKSRHFFVLAPNLTIYEKLIQDFTPGTKKYVFEGLPDFAVRPAGVLTGETYSQTNIDQFELTNDIIINVFNVAKLTTNEQGRMRKLTEYLGQSYFDYLSQLDDLVLLMDESHRYRATAGARAIEELKPILGLELTATPKSTGARPTDFKNVIYSYPLSAAMADGFVKEPHVATRENFNTANYTADALERLKLEDGMTAHEFTKVKLQGFAEETGNPVVKPFVLVVAQDTTHAESLKALIDSDGFRNGEYKGKVITVHSNQKSELKDEALQSLLNVESSDEVTEIVIHVNKLGEGWDVTNLYTIIPLRASVAEILTEQTIGRGLRLPFGKRTGVNELDMLVIVSHDRYQAIIDQARSESSIIRKGVVIGRDIPFAKERLVKAQTRTETALFGGTVELVGGGTEEHPALFSNAAELEVAHAAYKVVLHQERLLGSKSLTDDDVKSKIESAVMESLGRSQGAFAEMDDKPDIAEICKTVVTKLLTDAIRIPRVVIQPAEGNRFDFVPFILTPPEHRYQPVSSDILIQALRTNEITTIGGGDGVVTEKASEDYLVKHLIDFDDVSYDANAELLYDLSGQMVVWLRSYLTEEEDVRNVLQYHGRQLAKFIHDQMQLHLTELETEFEEGFSTGFETLQGHSMIALSNENVKDHLDGNFEKSKISQYLFDNFDRCTSFVQKFDVDTERQFAGILERSTDVIRWVKPGRGQVRIYLPAGNTYNPDFVVEAADRFYLCETKARNQMETEEVQLKRKAALKWCEVANRGSGKPWSYALVPHDEVVPTATFQGLMAAHAEPR